MLSFSFMFSMLIYVVVCIHFLITKYYSGIWIYHNLFIWLSVDGHMSCFHIFSFLLETSRYGIAGPLLNCLTFSNCQAIFSSECTLIYIPISNVQGLMNTSLPLKSFPSLCPWILMGPSTWLTLLDILLWESWPEQFLTFLYFLCLSWRSCYSSVSSIPISFGIHSSSGIEVFPTQSLAHESVIWSTSPNCPMGE